MSEIRIAIDAMGGDDAPRVPVEGACLAAASSQLSIALVGKASLIQAELDRINPPPPAGRISIVDTPEWIEMGESPGTALRTKKGASVVLAAKMVADGEAQVMVSAGNSGAAMGAAVLKMKTLEGIERPAIAVNLPTHQAEHILLDAGATVDCRPQNLLQFARMGATYARCCMELDNPRVGLLSIGEEASKGNALTIAAHQLLRESGLNFIGNIEPGGMLKGDADVIVCDGFVGNMVLKSMESIAEFALEMFAARGPASAASPEDLLKGFRKQLDWAEYGGALLLGVKGLCIISHGRSTPTAIARAIEVGRKAVERRVIESIS